MNKLPEFLAHLKNKQSISTIVSAAYSLEYSRNSFAFMCHDYDSAKDIYHIQEDVMRELSVCFGLRVDKILCFSKKPRDQNSKVYI